MYTQFIEYKGKQIAFLDFSGVEETAEALERIEEARQFIADQPERSVLTLTYVQGSTFNATISSAIKDLAEHNRPYVVAGAVVGVNALTRVVLNTIVHLTGRKLVAFDDLDQAKDWLIEQN